MVRTISDRKNSDVIGKNEGVRLRGGGWDIRKPGKIMKGRKVRLAVEKEGKF